VSHILFKDLQGGIMMLDYESIPNERLAQAFVDIMEAYMSPAFGSMTKRDMEILLFMKLEDLGLISLDAEIYDIVTTLRVTRSKARNLLYDARLRSTNQEGLERQLIELLCKPNIDKSGDHVILELDNPYLIDYMRSRLRKLGHLTDGSFSQEIVKLRVNAFTELLVSTIPHDRREKIVQELDKEGYLEKSSFSKYLDCLFRFTGKTLAGDMGEIVAEDLHQMIEGFFKTNSSLSSNKIIHKYSKNK
jgi:hypothetical protein